MIRSVAGRGTRSPAPRAVAACRSAAVPGGSLSRRATAPFAGTLAHPGGRRPSRRQRPRTWLTTSRSSGRTRQPNQERPVAARRAPRLGRASCSSRMALAVPSRASHGVARTRPPNRPARDLGCDGPATVLAELDGPTARGNRARRDAGRCHRRLRRYHDGTAERARTPRIDPAAAYPAGRERAGEPLASIDRCVVERARSRRELPAGSLGPAPDLVQPDARRPAGPVRHRRLG